jgi:Tfp pilus assembly protein PilO
VSGERKPVKGKGRSLWKRFDVRREGLRVAIVFTVLLVVNVGFWWIVVRPLQNEITAREEQRRTAQVTEAESLKRLEEIRSVHQHVEDVRQGIETFFEEMLSVREERLVPFQRAVHDVGEKFRVQPQRVAINRVELMDEGIEVLRFNFPLNGGYENLRQFLAELESLDQFLLVREVSLRSGAREGGRQLQLDITVETYFNAPGMKEEAERERLWREKGGWRASGRGRR